MGDALATVDLGTGNIARAIAAGWHTCAILQNWDVKCWGKNLYGQLGLGDNADRGDSGRDGRRAAQGRPGPGRTAKFIAAGHHTCARLDDNTLKCWGGTAMVNSAKATRSRAAITRMRWARTCRWSTSARGSPWRCAAGTAHAAPCCRRRHEVLGPQRLRRARARRYAHARLGGERDGRQSPARGARHGPHRSNRRRWRKPQCARSTTIRQVLGRRHYGQLGDGSTLLAATS